MPSTSPGKTSKSAPASGSLRRPRTESTGSASGAGRGAWAAVSSTALPTISSASRARFIPFEAKVPW